jgi:hypothetical protein
MNSAIESIADIDSILNRICIETPTSVPLVADRMAEEVIKELNSFYGNDTSNVRAMLTHRKVADMARAHLRRSFDTEKTAQQEQLAFTEFGDDIQARYPIKTNGPDVEYQSPMYAPVDQLAEIAEKSIRVGSTHVRRGNALMAFLVEYRNFVAPQG